LLALITLGEGWHNNHHRYQASTRNGFFWNEIDITYSLLKLMSWVGLVSNLTPVPEKILEEGRHNKNLRKVAAKKGQAFEPRRVQATDLQTLKTTSQKDLVADQSGIESTDSHL